MKPQLLNSFYEHLTPLRTWGTGISPSIFIRAKWRNWLHSLEPRKELSRSLCLVLSWWTSHTIMMQSSPAPFPSIVWHEEMDVVLQPSVSECFYENQELFAVFSVFFYDVEIYSSWSRIPFNQCISRPKRRVAKWGSGCGITAHCFEVLLRESGVFVVFSVFFYNSYNSGDRFKLITYCFQSMYQEMF